MAGLRALLPGLRLLASSPHMTSAREEIMYGAYLAAVAFASAGSGLHHKICHVLGGAFNLPHAPMHSIVLPYVTAFNLSSSPAAEAALTELFPMESPAVALDALRRELGSPKSLAEIGLKEQEISRAAALVFPDVPPSNPRPVSIDALTSIISDAWIGAPITKEPL
jgi:maleylacetate reductase